MAQAEGNSSIPELVDINTIAQLVNINSSSRGAVSYIKLSSEVYQL